MDYATLLNLSSEPNTRAGFLLETFLLRLLAHHLEKQGRMLQTHVKIGRSEAGPTYEADAVATEGIDDIPGPVIVELCLAAPSPHRVTHDIARIDNVVQYANAKSAILIFGRRMQGATKSAIRRTLRAPKFIPPSAEFAANQARFSHGRMSGPTTNR